MHVQRSGATEAKTRVIYFNHQRVAIAQNRYSRAFAHTKITQTSRVMFTAHQFRDLQRVAALAATQRSALHFVRVMQTLPPTVRLLARFQTCSQS